MALVVGFGDGFYSNFLVFGDSFYLVCGHIRKLYNSGISIYRSLSVNIYLRRLRVMYILIDMWGFLNIFAFTMLVYINLVPHISD